MTGGDWPARQDMRSWLRHLDTHGELGRIRTAISPKQEVSAVLDRVDGRRAVLFDRIDGARFPLAGNLLPGRAPAVDALMAVLALGGTVKRAVVVDDDVDIFDDEQVGWAVATRVQADRDVHVVPRARGSSLDPSAPDGVTAKLGIDATVRGPARARHARMRVGPVAEERLARFLAEVEAPGRAHP
ncbi:UbiD family decarboxylase domain-containing protein [Mangrovihabitans endophyticus]|uniref:UbiD family decarboxylase n=1 Tax=Mangrovihabitans endophyticus TaxID=1751298 RepID=A0A8J3FN49_9ACTN|nr:UbiD family decarboxylase domain-containing protein [Mangrovihabitans endophyticus]GGK78577.1 hypothetical protein GCM10012284_10600 [Mangrovihabitans endophyticus]